MFGDCGHGALMNREQTHHQHDVSSIECHVCQFIQFSPRQLLFPEDAMIFWEKKLARTKLDELTYMAFYGRYIMLMMGLRHGH
jgi:hypothetical protein